MLHHIIRSSTPEELQCTLECMDQDTRYKHVNHIYNGRTPLSLAVFLGEAEMVDILINHHANPYIADASGKTPLMLALEALDLRLKSYKESEDTNPYPAIVRSLQARLNADGRDYGLLMLYRNSKKMPRAVKDIDSPRRKLACTIL